MNLLRPSFLLSLFIFCCEKYEEKSLLRTERSDMFPVTSISCSALREFYLISFQTHRNTIVFRLVHDQKENVSTIIFGLVHNQKEKCKYEHITLNFKLN